MNLSRYVIYAITCLALLGCGGGGSTNNEPDTTASNHAPTGSISIVGNAIVAQTLTINNSLNDADGLGQFSYQWQRSGSNIDNATDASYVVSSADVGATLTVVLSYTDGAGYQESVTSAATAIIVAASTPPNILLIISDDQGLDASAQYSLSSDIPNTPTLNQLASEGIVFDNAWATPACTTTRGTMMTGQFGINSGISYVPAVMDSSMQTLPRYLKSNSVTANYSSAVFGKWHLGGANPDPSHPNDSGVDYYAGNIAGTLSDYFDWPLVTNGVTSTSSEYHTSKVTDLAIDWINGQSKPWFVWLAYVAPHSPWHLPPENLQDRSELTGTDSDINNHKRDYYLAAIEAMDTEIGRLLDAMPTATRDNTIIIYIGDNGTPASVIDRSVFSGEHSKSSLYEGGIRIPMIVSGKGVSRHNERESALVNTVDFYATIGELAGINNASINDSISFADLLDSNTRAQASTRQYNYAEFESSSETGWAVRDQNFKLIHRDDGSEQLFDISTDLNESDDLLLDSNDHTAKVSELTAYADGIRHSTSSQPLDITNQIFSNSSGNCQSYVENYQSTVMDINRSQVFNGDLQISVSNGKCVFHTNDIPNHDFNDGASSFPNNVSAQNKNFEITTTPTWAAATTALSLATDNALMLNGVKVDLLAAACYGVGDGKVGCNDINQAWRYDPMHAANGFQVDSHNAHVQPDGSYHYHGSPNAMFNADSNSSISPVVGFAADGFPIYGSYFNDNGTIRKAFSSYKLKSGTRPTGSGNPGGSYDGTYRDDYQYEAGYGDLDECNGMTIDGQYGYYITDSYPYVLNCFKGTPDPSFNK